MINNKCLVYGCSIVVGTLARNYKPDQPVHTCFLMSLYFRLRRPLLPLPTRAGSASSLARTPHLILYRVSLVVYMCPATVDLSPPLLLHLILFHSVSSRLKHTLHSSYIDARHHYQFAPSSTYSLSRLHSSFSIFRRSHLHRAWILSIVYHFMGSKSMLQAYNGVDDCQLRILHHWRHRFDHPW